MREWNSLSHSIRSTSLMSTREATMVQRPPLTGICMHVLGSIRCLKHNLDDHLSERSADNYPLSCMREIPSSSNDEDSRIRCNRQATSRQLCATHGTGITKIPTCSAQPVNPVYGVVLCDPRLRLLGEDIPQKVAPLTSTCSAAC